MEIQSGIKAGCADGAYEHCDEYANNDFLNECYANGGNPSTCDPVAAYNDCLSCLDCVPQV